MVILQNIMYLLPISSDFLYGMYAQCALKRIPNSLIQKLQITNQVKMKPKDASLQKGEVLINSCFYKQ